MSAARTSGNGKVARPVGDRPAGATPQDLVAKAVMGSEFDSGAAILALEALRGRFLDEALPRLNYSWILDPVLRRTCKSHLLAMAPTQSGKTRLMCEAAFLAMNSGVPVTPIIIFQRKVSDFHQFRERWLGSFQTQLRELDGGQVFKFGQPELMSRMRDSDLREAFNRNGRSVLACALANKVQLERFRSWLERCWTPEEHGNFVIIKDEADECVAQMGMEHKGNE